MEEKKFKGESAPRCSRLIHNVTKPSGRRPRCRGSRPSCKAAGRPATLRRWSLRQQLAQLDPGARRRLYKGNSPRAQAAKWRGAPRCTAKSPGVNQASWVLKEVRDGSYGGDPIAENMGGPASQWPQLGRARGNQHGPAPKSRFPSSPPGAEGKRATTEDFVNGAVSEDGLPRKVCCASPESTC